MVNSLITGHDVAVSLRNNARNGPFSNDTSDVLIGLQYDNAPAVSSCDLDVSLIGCRDFLMNIINVCYVINHVFFFFLNLKLPHPLCELFLYVTLL